MSEYQVPDEISQSNKFIRGANKKSSLKTGKTTKLALHQTDKLGNEKTKTIKWNTDELNIEKHEKHISKKKLEEVKTHYVAYVNTSILQFQEGDDEYLKKLNEVNSKEATNELLLKLQSQLSLNEEEEMKSTPSNKVILLYREKFILRIINFI